MSLTIQPRLKQLTNLDIAIGCYQKIQYTRDEEGLILLHKPTPT